MGTDANPDPAAKARRVHDLGGRRCTVLSVQPMAELGGSDQAMLRLARQLCQAGWSVHLVLPAPSPMAQRYREAGAQLHVVPMQRISTSHDALAWATYLLSWPVTVIRLWRLARRVQPDVVHTNSLHSWYGWAVAALLRRPHVWHAREIVTQSGAALRLERILCRHFATTVVAVSTAVAHQLDPANVQVVREGVSREDYKPSMAGTARKRLDLADDRPLVGYVGRIDTWKGVHVLVEAVPLLRAQIPGIQVVIAGGAVLGKEAFASDLERSAILAGVLWVGQIAGPEAALLLADLDCMAYPSTGPEPWGLSVVEALACGVPVVSTDAAGPREITAGLPASAARLVQPGDAEGLAQAIASLLPPSTSAAARKGRSPLLEIPDPAYPELFGAACTRKEA